MDRNRFSYILIVAIPFVIMLILMHMLHGIGIKILLYSINYLFLIITFFIKKEKNILSIQFLFTIYHMIFIGLCPIFLTLQYLLLNRQSSLISTIIYESSFIDQQCFLILISYFVFLIATTIFYKKKKEKYIDIPLIKNDSKNILKYSKFICYVMIVVSILLELIYIIKNKALLFGGNLENGRILAMSGNGIYLYGIWLGTFGIAMLYECVLRKEVNPKLFLAICVFHIISISLIGFRSRIIVLVLFLLIIHNRYKKIKIRKLLKIGVFLLFVVAILTFGRNILSGSSNNSIIINMVALFGNGSINIYYVLKQFPSITPFQYGKIFLLNFLMLAPGSQPDFTIWLKNQIGISFSGGGITPTLVGEGWMNFGFIGTVVMFFVAGILCNKLDNHYYKTKNVYFVTLPIWVITSSVRGGFSNSLINLVIFSFMNLLLFIIFKKERDSIK